MSVGHPGERGEVEVDLRRLLDRARRAGPARLRPPVDPGGGETEGAGGGAVVEQALRGVQDPALHRPEVALQTLQHVVEVPRVGLVGADVLGGVDRVELHFELLVAGREPGPVDVRQDDQPEAPLEVPERRRGVREGRPVRHRGAERPREGRVRVDAPVAGDRGVDRGEDLGVGRARGARLLLVLAAPEGGDPLLRADRLPGGASGARGEGLEGGRDPGLPVDEGAVAVEGQGVEVGELHAGRSSVRRAIPAARTSSRVAAGESAWGSIATSMSESPRWTRASSSAVSNSSSLSTRTPKPP